MIVKEITYEDYRGNIRTDKFHFNLSKAELMEMEASEDGGLSARLQQIVDSQSAPEIMKVFKSFILKSYGVVSPNGVSFIKDPEATRAFEQSEAYSELIIELLNDADKAAAFINGIVPSSIANQIPKQD